MLTVTLTVIALAVAGFVVWIAARRSNIVQRVSGNLSGPVEQMQEQILLTADTAVDRLDGKIAQMEILLAEIDRRSTILAQQTKQQQLAQLHLEQQQQQLVSWLQSQRQLLETEFQRRQQDLLRNQAATAAVAAPITAPVATTPTVPENPATLPQPDNPVAVEERSGPNFRPTPRPKLTRPAIAGSRKELPDAQTAPATDKRAAILEMAEQARSVTDIAQTMGIGKGEVMLLLKLRKKTAT